jgi:hypothetical protein
LPVALQVQNKEERAYMSFAGHLFEKSQYTLKASTTMLFCAVPGFAMNVQMVGDYQLFT